MPARSNASPAARTGTTSSRARIAGVLLVLPVACGLLAGCGKDEDKKTDPLDDQNTSAPTAMPSNDVTTAPGDIASTTAPTETAKAVPKGGPTGIGTFPVPPGQRIKGPEPQDRSWQFDIFTKDTDKVLAFYRKALPKAGYKVRTNVTRNVGAEVVKYDIEFDGPANGFIVAIPDDDDVFVSVQSPPDLSVPKQ